MTENQMIIDALEFRVYHLEKDNCDQVEIDSFTDLLYRLQREELRRTL